MGKEHIVVAINAKKHAVLGGLLVDYLPGEITITALHFAGANPGLSQPLIMERPEQGADRYPAYWIFFFRDNPLNRLGLILALVAAGAADTLIKIVKETMGMRAPILMLSSDPDREGDDYRAIMATLQQISEGQGVTLTAN